MTQFFQQRFRLLQVFGVKAFGEPVVNLGQQLPGFFLLALLLPQPAQTHHRAQLQGLGTLAAGNLNGLMKTRFGFRLRLGAGCWVLGISDPGLRTPDCSDNSPLTRYSSASHTRSPVLSITANAWASTVSPSSTCP